MSDVEVGLDEPLRTWTAALALSGWPAREQAEKPHKPHRLARRLHQTLVDRPLSDSAAVDRIDRQLADDRPLSAIAREMVAERQLLADFATQTRLPSFWGSHESLHNEAAAELSQIFNGLPLRSFMSRLLQRPLRDGLTLMPNFLAPALRALVVPRDKTLWVLLPPPQAWGESPPWPYKDGVEWVLSQVCGALLSYFVSGRKIDISPRDLLLLQHAATTLFIEQALGEADSKAYLLQTKRELDIPELTLLVEQLQLLLEGNGRSESILDLFQSGT